MILVHNGPEDDKHDDPIDLFMKVAFNMREYLNEDNMLGTLSTVGDAVLWRQLVAEYPELLAFLYNEPDSVASHWNAFFRVFYGWYWRIHDYRAENREVWAPLVRKLSGVRFRRTRKRKLDKSNDVTTLCQPCPVHVMTISHRMRQTPPEVHNVARLFQRENLAMVANWLAWRSDKSLERQQFAALVKSIGLSKHVCWEEKLFRLLNFSLPSWFRHGAHRSSKALSPVFQLMERSGMDSQGERDGEGGGVEAAGEYQSLQSNASVLADLNESVSVRPGAAGIQRFNRSVTGDSAWTTATQSSG